MTEALKKLFDSYFNVLSKLGYMKQGNTNVLLISAFLRHYLGFKASIITRKEVKEIIDMFECLLHNSCMTLSIPQGVSPLIDVTPSGGSTTTENDLVISYSDGSADNFNGSVEVKLEAAPIEDIENLFKEE